MPTSANGRKTHHEEAEARGTFSRMRALPIGPCIARLTMLLVLGTFTLFAGAATAFGSTLARGDRSAFSVTGSAPNWLTVTGGRVWFTDDGGATVRSINDSGTVQSSTASGTRTFGITATADGRVWFANQTNTGWGVGRVEADGSAPTWFQVTSDPAVQDLAVGSDGKVWFTEWSGGHIGRVDADGTISRFPTGIGSGSGYSITLGDDGNMWFTYIDIGRYGRITPSGTVTTWSTGYTGLSGIAADGNGHVWITEERANKLLKVSTAGVNAGTVVAEFSTPAQGPRQIALGPDDGMWFAMFEGRSIGRIDRTATSSGPPPTIEQWPAAPASQSASSAGPFDIVWGPDGSMWYSNLVGGSIGRIGTGFTTAVPGGGGSAPPSSGGGSGGGTSPPPSGDGGNASTDSGSTVGAPSTGCATPPTGPVGVSINGGDAYTNSPNVVLDVVWPACTTTVTVANDGGFRSADARATAAQISWKLSTSGSERLPKTVYLRFGTSSQNYTDDIILDQSAPKILSATASVAQVAERRAATGRTVRVAVRALDRGGSGPAAVQIRSGRKQTTSAYGKGVTIATNAAAIRVRVRDRAGNWSAFRTVPVR
jgi:streptogramin lyase